MNHLYSRAHAVGGRHYAHETTHKQFKEMN